MMEPETDTPPPPSSRLAPAAISAVIVLGLAAAAWLSLRGHETSIMESEPQVSRPEPIPDRLWQADGRVRGDVNAPVTLIEYSDYTCGYCGKFFRDTWPVLSKKYVETGKLRFLYRDYPRDPEGAGMAGAIAARCAGDQGKYWQMHDRLFDQGLEAAPLAEHARTLGLDRAKFDACLRDASYRQAILREKEDGMKLGFVGTPGFLLVRTAQAGREKPIGLPGAFPAAVFEEEIEKLLKPSGGASKG
jgi:protein-disulfide isomerase